MHTEELSTSCQSPIGLLLNATSSHRELRANPKSVRFADACKAAAALGFVHKGGAGSHRAFARPGEPTLLNFQNRDGCIPPYQARQLIAMIEKYGDEQ